MLCNIVAEWKVLEKNEQIRYTEYNSYLFIPYVVITNFILLSSREAERERKKDLLISYLLGHCQNTCSIPELGQVKAMSLELNPGPLCRWQGQGT